MINQRIRDYLDAHQVEYECISHPPAFSAQRTAQTAHIKGRQLAKTVVAKIDGQMALLVLHADERVSLPRLKQTISARSVALGSEEEFSACFPDCEAGAVPPFGEPYGLPLLISRSLRQEPEFICCGGSHRDLIKMKYQDYLRLARPEERDFVM